MPALHRSVFRTNGMTCGVWRLERVATALALPNMADAEDEVEWNYCEAENYVKMDGFHWPLQRKWTGGMNEERRQTQELFCVGLSAGNH